MKKEWSYRIILGLVVLGGVLFIKGYQDFIQTGFSIIGMSTYEIFLFIGSLIYFTLLIGAIILTVNILLPRAKSKNPPEI